MLFVAVIDWYDGKVLEAIRRRPNWHPPKEVKLLGEYWQIGTGQVVLIAEAPDPIAAGLATLPWEDIGRITVAPAVTGEEGMDMLKRWLEQAHKG
jgi:hypothetical protein